VVGTSLCVSPLVIFGITVVERSGYNTRELVSHIIADAVTILRTHKRLDHEFAVGVFLCHPLT